MQLSAAQGDGASLRTHLQRAAPYTGADPLLVQAAQPLHGSVGHLWAAFATLRSSADGPIRCTEITAWQQLHRVRLSPWEAETLLAMDRAARDAEDTPVRKDLKP